MLNRRILRIKVMQSVYAYTQAERAQFELGKDLIAHHFAPDLNSMEPHDATRAEGLTKLATLTYLEKYSQSDMILEESDSLPAAIKAAELARRDYLNGVASEGRRLGGNLELSIQQLYNHYLQLLLLLPAIGKLVQQLEDDKAHKYMKVDPAPVHTLKLARNPVLAALENNQQLHELAVRKGLGWEQNSPLVRKLYKRLTELEDYVNYTNAPEDIEYASHFFVAQQITKQLIFKDEDLDAHFNEADLFWAENKEVLKNMVVRTLKTVEQPGSEPVLTFLSADWEEDKLFMQDLYKHSVANFNEYVNLVSQHLNNWDSDRLARLDKIIIVMAVVEMLHMPGIPVKVTINEALELAKQYSTPQSKQFINGVLDAVAEGLKTAGKLRKSGRGLMDN